MDYQKLKFKDIQNSKKGKNTSYIMEYNREQIQFLDILVIKEEENVGTDIFCKPTDTHQYVNFRSAHSSYIKRNIAF